MLMLTPKTLTVRPFTPTVNLKRLSLVEAQALVTREAMKLPSGRNTETFMNGFVSALEAAGVITPDNGTLLWHRLTKN